MYIKNKNDFQLKLGQNGCLTAKMIDNSECDYSVLYNRLDAGKSSNQHAHDDCDELYYIIDGSGILNVADESKSIVTGDMVVIPKGAFHFLTNESDTPVEFLTIGFSGGLYDGWKMWLHGVNKPS